MSTNDPPPSMESSTADEPARAAPYSGENSASMKRRYLLRRFWKSAVGFWRNGGDRLSWYLGGLLLLISLLNLATAYGMNVWNRGMFDALEKRDSQTVLLLSFAYFALLAISVLFNVLLVYARMTAQRRWRAWLNEHLIDRWLAKGRYYQLNFVGGDHKNPEYRIADDVRIATESPVEFATGMTAALLSATTFIAVLWTIGGSLTFELRGVAVTIPGFLVIAAVIYAVAASGSMTLIANRFIPVAERKNQAEAQNIATRSHGCARMGSGISGRLRRNAHRRSPYGFLRQEGPADLIGLPSRAC